MSWYVYLKGAEDECVAVDSFDEGGTRPIGGSTEACLNITYNYSWFYYHFLDKKDGLEWLDGKKAQRALPRLRKACTALPNKPWQDYWAPTPGNAGHAMAILLKWAESHPRARFQVN